MTEKAKCSACGERDVFSKGLCSGCYGRQWRERRKAERASEPKLLTSGVTDAELEVIDGEIIHDGPPETHLVATSPVEMQAAQGDLKTWLEQRLTILERDIREANAALNEARRNGWATGALTSARNRAVDDETFYNKILAAVEAGHTIIPDFPISIFAVRRHEPDGSRSQTFNGSLRPADTWMGNPVEADCAPAGTGEYRNPEPEVSRYATENRAPGAQERGEPRWFTHMRRTGRPAGPIVFPRVSGRSPVMKATAKAMAEKTFDQVGVCLPTTAVAGGRQVQRSTRAGDPLIIGQVLRKRQGGYQKAVSFIIAWHLNLSDL
jgi:hypothetical protein